jgi:hypothetical protein
MEPMTSVNFDEQLRRAFDSLADRLRTDINQHLQAATSELSATVEAGRASAAADAARDAALVAQKEISALKLTVAEAEAQTTQAEAQSRQAQDMAQQFKEQVRQGQDQARESAAAQARETARTAPKPPDLAASERLVDAIRAIDRARSLSELLDTVVNCAGREAARAAIFLVRGAEFRSWRGAGFGPAMDPPGAIVVAIPPAGIIGDAARSGAPAASGNGLSAPPFAALGADRPALALPIVVGGAVVAVLYADQGGAGESAREPWSAALEVIARHAARSLEAVTAFRTAQVVTGRDDAMSGGHPATRLANDDIEGAQRYARLLVSEIKLYHEADVIAGRRDRDLMTRLGGEIARARALYDQRVAADPRRTSDHFTVELLRTLAEGDASLLQVQ